MPLTQSPVAKKRPIPMGVWELNYTYSTTLEKLPVEVTERIIAASERAAHTVIKQWAFECNFTNLEIKTSTLKEKIEIF